MRWRGAILALMAAWSAAASEGLLATFKSGGAFEAIVLPNFAFFAPSNQPPVAFVPSGPFQVEMDGFISADLRTPAVFSAESTGEFLLSLNGRPILTNSGQSASVLLRKGTNHLSAIYKSNSGDNQLRVQWIPRRTFLQPIPTKLLSHDPSKVQQDSELRLGRALFLENRCSNCHHTEGNSPELSMDAPAFDHIGSRLSKKWMQDWITNPTNASMPNVFHGNTKKSEAAANYLATLTGKSFPSATGNATSGQKIFQTQNCAACHTADFPLDYLRRKYKQGALEDYLSNPAQYYPWTKMPTYKLSPAERADLAAFLRQDKKPEPDSPLRLVDEGKLLVEKNCMACHSLKGKKVTSSAPAFVSLNPAKGCLAVIPPSNVPLYSFTAEERKALQNFVTVKKPVTHALMEFAARKLAELKCASCHSTVGGIPPVHILGGKLTSHTLTQMISGAETSKPRYWMPAQMPAFPTYSKYLSEGMSALHGFSAHDTYSPSDRRFPTGQPPTPPPDLAAAGQKLVSAPPHGFSCISCHAIGEFGSKEPFESPGINLALSYNRLRPDYFHRWLRNPTLIDPLTKMPVYFDDEGRSPLIEILNGDAPAQIEAIWQYLKQPEILPPYKN